MHEEELRHKFHEVNGTLEEMYGVPRRENEQDPLNCLIHTILSQNTNDENSSRAYARLRERFETWQDALEAEQEEIMEAIRIGGLSNQKSATIRRVLVWLQQTRGCLNLDFVCRMPTDEAVAMLIQIKGVGLKTISVMLCFACGQDVFPVDTHILRVSKRLGLIPPNTSAGRAHALLGALCPEGKAFPLHVNLICFGRDTCHARQPKCNVCPLLEDCVWVSDPSRL